MSEPARMEFHDDPASFLEVAGRHLRRRPVLSTVVATQAQQEAAVSPLRAPAPTAEPRWYLAVRDASGEVVGVAMRTGRYAPYLQTLPDGSAEVLGDVLVERGESVDGCNGALPAARVLAEHVAARTGRRAQVQVHTRLFELPSLIEPTPVPGALRLAWPDELDLVTRWFNAFRADADTQAGRQPPTAAHRPQVTRQEIGERIAGRQIWLGKDVGGSPVHLTCARPPAYGVRRLGPVYTPAEHRGNGYASSAVAEVSRMILAEGARACLFTDRANPVSNHLYEALGYRPVVDMAKLVLHGGE